MDNFCGSTFWDDSLTWNTSRPDFTPCFQDTALVWAPCGFLWLLAPLDVFFNYHSKAKHIPWTILTIAKIVLASILGILSLVDMGRAMILYSNGHHVDPSNYYASFIEALTLILVIVLINLGRIRGTRTSAVLFLFWLLMSIKELISYYSVLLRMFNDNLAYSKQADDFTFIIVTCSFVLTFGELILFSFADSRPDYAEAGLSQAKESPEDAASFLSNITFWWFNRMAILGYRQPLRMENMWSLSNRNTSEAVMANFDKYWIPIAKKALQESKLASTASVDVLQGKSTEDPDVKVEQEPRLNLIYPLLKSFAWEVTGCALLKLIASLMVFVSPIILDLLITFVTSDAPSWQGFFYAAVLFFASMVESIFNNQYEYNAYLISMKVRSAVTAAIYRKSLLLSGTARRNFTVGEIVNLMAVDIQRVMDYFQMVHLLWAAPLQIVIALYMLWGQIGISTLAGLGVMFLLVPMNGYVTVKLRDLQIIVMRMKDKRTKLMNEVLSGMKVLKLYAWEESFQEKVVDIRKSEVEQLYKQAYLSAAILFAFTSAPFLVALASFAMFVLIDPANILDANKAFVSLSLFNILRVPFAFLPMLITFTAMFLVSLKRLNIYLGCDEVDQDSISYNKNEESPVIIENGTFSWDSKEEALLKDINLRLTPGSLVAVVGTVGAGKSSLLSALLGDMEKISGRVNISGKMAYVPQQAWIQNASLRKNILFIKPFEERRYNKVLEACCLVPDLEILPGRDQTEIGEKGINLSGGQKQRISLARAVYNDADIYLLDDPLSAVDAHVSKDLFDNVIGPNGMLKKSTRILVTHRITVLPEVDTIIVLKDGRISEEGSYEELLRQKGAFAEFLVHHISQVANAEDMVSPDDLLLIEQIANKVGSPELQRQLSRLSGGESDGALSGSDDSLSLSRKFSTQMSITSATSTAETLRRRSSVLGTKRQNSVLPKDDKLSARGLLAEKSKLIEAETSEVGSVKWAIYWQYFKACGMKASVWVLISHIISHAFNIGSSIWLSEWSNDSTDPAKINDTDLRDLRLGVYGGLGGAEAIFVLVGSVVLSVSCLTGSKIIHDRSLHHILQAPMSFFDTTPLGRILNRFSKDVDSMDNTLRQNLRMLLICVFKALVALIIISLQTPYFLVVIVPLGVIYYLVQKFYIASSRQLKRLESVSRSPIYTHFTETVTGCSSIRAYGAEERFITESNNRVDANNTTYFPSLTSNRWLAIRLEFLGYTISFLAALFAVLSRGTLSGGLAGLSISYALTITSTLNMLVRASADVETNIVSVERCLEYTTTPTEAPRRIESTKPPASWPSEGRIQFNNYSTRYREGLDLVLKKINCVVNPKEKVGIVGRTGAGKSSLTLCLFRLIEAAEGNITIDGIDITNLGLYDLRSKLTIIPQDPVLFTGTVRLNLDPFSNHSDDELWSVLEQSHLKAYTTSLEKGLDHIITEGGENLSVGQRQLLCLARALLRKTKVLIMDEATAAVDMETDELIQATIRSEFSECTVFTIAHRLNTVLDYDRVIVLDKGAIAEFDSPTNLLQNDKSIFHAMAKDADLV